MLYVGLVATASRPVYGNEHKLLLPSGGPSGKYKKY